MLMQMRMQIRQLRTAAKRYDFVSSDSGKRDEFPQGNSRGPVKLIVHAVDGFGSDLAPLSGEALLSGFHLLPLLLGNGCHSVVANVQRASD